MWESHCTQQEAGGDGGEYANVAEAHVAHAEFLWRRLGNVEAARGVYKRCYARAALESVALESTSAADGQAVVCRAWLRMEREAGTAETYATADGKAGVKLRAAEAEAAEKKVLLPEEAKRMRQANDPNYKGAAAAGDGEGSKRKAADEGDGAEEQPSAKRARGDDKEGDDKEGDDKVALPTNPAARAAKYKEFYPDRDQRTAFVKNLPFKCTEEELGAFFDARGGKVIARMVKDKATGRSRGFAYVEFSEEGALQVAIMRWGCKSRIQFIRPIFC